MAGACPLHIEMDRSCAACFQTRKDPYHCLPNVEVASTPYQSPGQHHDTVFGGNHQPTFGDFDSAEPVAGIAMWEVDSWLQGAPQINPAMLAMNTNATVFNMGDYIHDDMNNENTGSSSNSFGGQNDWQATGEPNFSFSPAQHDQQDTVSRMIAGPDCVSDAR
jgi:hypothetical protein